MKRKSVPVRNLALALQGTLATTPQARKAILALLAALNILFGFFRFRGG